MNNSFYEKSSLGIKIEKIMDLCTEFDNENKGEYSSFSDPDKEDLINTWEKENCAIIPESYKEWLSFTSDCVIAANTASFRNPMKFHSEYVSDDIVIIGDLVGDGERIGFSKNTGKFIEMFEDQEIVKGSFEEVLDDVINMLSNTPMLTHDMCSRIFSSAASESELQLRKGTIKFLDFLTRPNTPKLTNTAYGMIEVEDRRQVMQLLNPKERRELILKLRNQSVQDFWTHEQELLRNGKCTRNWNADQYESIMNISKETGNAGEIGGVAKDQEGRIYFGRHMMNPNRKPEYAGDWRNVQALTYTEYFEGVLKLKKNVAAHSVGKRASIFDILK